MSNDSFSTETDLSGIEVHLGGKPQSHIASEQKVSTIQIEEGGSAEVQLGAEVGGEEQTVRNHYQRRVEDISKQLDNLPKNPETGEYLPHVLHQAQNLQIELGTMEAHVEADLTLARRADRNLALQIPKTRGY